MQRKLGQNLQILVDSVRLVRLLHLHTNVNYDLGYIGGFEY